IRVTEAVRDGDALTFIVISQKVSSSGEYHVARTHEDFQWLQQCLFSQEVVPGILGVIFPPLPAKPQLNAPAKVLKQLGFLAMGEDWRMYCMALETYLQQVAAHTTLSKNKCLENFLTSSEVCYYHKTLFSFSSCLILPFSQCPILSCSILSSFVRLDGECHCTAIFRSLQRCSIRFRSGLWLGHSRTFRDLSRSHPCVVLAVCLGSLSCWKGNLHPSRGPEHSGADFHQGSLCTLFR
uniref:PX domain-containing protein n=1 Tax=Oncorhynchus mykiss TaxID=8022 RepID=A0A8K9V2L4_ONCMY